jgi:hypothetical protein
VTSIHQQRERASGAARPNADGESLEPGRVPDCYLGLILDPSGTAEAPEVLVVAPAARLPPVSHGRSVPPADARL